MSFQFVVLGVSAEFMMDIAKAVASSPYPLSKKDILNSFTKSRVYVSNALSQCLQLGLVVSQDGLYVSSEKYRDLIKRSDRSQLYLPLREALQRYPPFLLYIDFISKEYMHACKAGTRAGKIEGGIPIVLEGMQKLEYGDRLLMFLKKGDRSTREKIARTAKKFIDIYVEEEESEIEE